MRVVLVTAFPVNPIAPRGGVEAVSVNLARALAAIEGLDVHVVAADTTTQEPVRNSWEGATIHRLPRLPGSTLRNAVGNGRRQFSDYVRGLNPAVVHSHDVYGLMVQDLGIPRVFTIHGFIHVDTKVSAGPFARLRSLAWRRVEVAGWAKQPHIISISPYVRERLSGLTKAMVHDIDNPISADFFNCVRNEHPATVFSAGVIGTRKNHHVLVEAAALLKRAGVPVRIRIAGHVGEPAYAERLKQRIEQLGMQPDVALLGRLTTGEIVGELSHAAVFALVSLEENSPMGVEEAMAAGVPVVTSNRCGMPYMVSDGESGFLVDPCDPADVASRIGELLSDADLRERFGAEGRAIALKRFHPDAVARRTLRVYWRACGQGRPT